MRMTPHEFALANGWDAGQIEDTARLGVSDADLPGLAAVGLTPDALLAWCLGRIEAEGTPGTTPTTRTITLTGRPPVEIREDEWPVVAGSNYHEYPREYDFHVSRRWLGLVQVRQHADGRVLVYADALYESALRIEPDYVQRVGDLLPAPATTEQIIDAIRRVHARIDIVDAGHAAAWRLLGEQCIADLPRAAYRDQTQTPTLPPTCPADAMMGKGTGRERAEKLDRDTLNREHAELVEALRYMVAAQGKPWDHADRRASVAAARALLARIDGSDDATHPQT